MKFLLPHLFHDHLQLYLAPQSHFPSYTWSSEIAEASYGNVLSLNSRQQQITLLDNIEESDDVETVLFHSNAKHADELVNDKRMEADTMLQLLPA